MARAPKSPTAKQVSTLTHEKSARKNIPTAEYQSVAERIEAMDPVEPVHYPRATPLAEGQTRERDVDRDPQIVWRGARIKLSKEQAKQLAETGEVEIGDAQLVWKGKDRQDWTDLVVQAPPLYIQEKIHPKAIIDDLVRRSKANAPKDDAPDLFADFNGLNDPEARTEFYQHDQHWSNRMILGDSLQVMASLAEREGLRGKVQCIYFDPPYGIKFNSNWQVSTQSRDVKDGKQTDISREPEQVKAFRDTWKEGIHSYLTYLRDRLTVMRDLLTESGSIFVQISDENVHRVRSLLDEVFGSNCFCSEIAFSKATGLSSKLIPSVFDYILWYCKAENRVKYRPLYQRRALRDEADGEFRVYDDPILGVRSTSEEERDELVAKYENRFLRTNSAISPGVRSNTTGSFNFEGLTFNSGPARNWKTTMAGMIRLAKASRIVLDPSSVRIYKQYWMDFPYFPFTNIWGDVRSQQDRIYVVQTVEKVIQRCILMATDPGDLVLDPTCGSGTSAYISEQWARRWVTMDTSRVALALARTRLMSARLPYFYLLDSADGRRKEQAISGKIDSAHQTVIGDIRQGFVYERAPHVSLKSIANNTQIDIIWDKWQLALEPLRASLNVLLSRTWEEWQIPREAGDPWSDDCATLLEAAKDNNRDPQQRAQALRALNAKLKRDFTPDQLPPRPYDDWPPPAMKAHADWWTARIARQKEIDASIAKAADVELLYDRPYEDKSKVRVAGPFTVESLSPHRVAPSDEEELIDLLDAVEGRAPANASAPPTDFAAMVLEHLKSAGVHQSEKRDAIRFTSLQPWPGAYIGAKGAFMEGETERQAAIFIGPEFGTMTRVDLVAAAREATDARADVLIACAFNFDAHASELTKLGPLPILKAKMNPDLHMAGDLKNTGKGNLFVVFGEPDIDVKSERDGRIVVKVKGIDVFDPNTGEIRSGDTKSIAAWFIDTDYNEESFFVRHAYFLGAGDPYKSLKTALQAEIDREAWETLYRDESRPFARPETGKIAVKVINHFGDEVMKVFRV